MRAEPSRSARRRRGLVLAVVAGVLLGAGAFTFRPARGGAYFRDGPEACLRCHVMRESVASWQASSHHAVATCSDCHVPHRSAWAALWHRTRAGASHAASFAAGTHAERIRLRSSSRSVVEANCVRCHREMTAFLRLAEEEGACDGDGGCVRCHAGAGHGT